MQKVISIASGEFVWAIGDDDLLTPDALKFVEDLFIRYSDVDFYFVNSFHLDYKYLKNFNSDDEILNLPTNMEKLSKKQNEDEDYPMNFMI